MTNTVFNESDHPRENGVFVDKPQSAPDLPDFTSNEFDATAAAINAKRVALSSDHQINAGDLARLTAASTAAEILKADPAARFLKLEESDQEGQQWWAGAVVDAEDNDLGFDTDYLDVENIPARPPLQVNQGRDGEPVTYEDQTGYEWLIVEGTKRFPIAKIDLLKALEAVK